MGLSAGPWGQPDPASPPPLPFLFVLLRSPSLPSRLAGLADRDEPGPLLSVCPSSGGMAGTIT